jgi:hypothetical protein
MQTTTALNFSLALFSTAEEHVRDLQATSRAAACSLWSWSSEGGTVFTGCCVAESVKYTNNCSSDKPTEVTKAWGASRYPGSAIEHVADLSNSAAPTVDTMAESIKAAFSAQLFGSAPGLADYVHIGCHVGLPFVSVWLGNVPDALPYTTGGAPAVDPNRSPLGDDTTTIIIGATVGGVGLCALCCALAFYVYQQRSSSSSSSSDGGKSSKSSNDKIVSGRFEEAGGQYGSTLGLKDATAPDNQIYAPPGGSVDSSDAIYAPDKIFNNIRHDTMLSARSATSFGGPGNSIGNGGVYAGMPPQQNGMPTMNTGMPTMSTGMVNPQTTGVLMTRTSQPGALMTRTSQPAIPVDTYYEW